MGHDTFASNMFKIIVLIVAATVVQDMEACCCTSREPFMTQTCIECLYGLSPGYTPVLPSCGCFKDIADPLASSIVKPGPTVLYFPEVVYPITTLDITPFYFNKCFGV